MRKFNYALCPWTASSLSFTQKSMGEKYKKLEEDDILGASSNSMSHELRTQAANCGVALWVQGGLPAPTLLAANGFAS